MPGQETSLPVKHRSLPGFMLNQFQLLQIILTYLKQGPETMFLTSQLRALDVQFDRRLFCLTVKWEDA